LTLSTALLPPPKKKGHSTPIYPQKPNCPVKLVMDMADILLTIDQVAEKTQLSIPAVRRMVKGKLIRCIKVNSRVWRFHWPSVLADLQKLS
jgi:hypothetical protein